MPSDIFAQREQLTIQVKQCASVKAAGALKSFLRCGQHLRQLQNHLRIHFAKTLQRRELLSHGFKFVGPTIVYAWMQAVGIVNDHAAHCFRRDRV